MKILNENIVLTMSILLIVIIGSVYLHSKGFLNGLRKPIFLIPLAGFGLVSFLMVIYVMILK